ncbi:MAG: hypothetical protein HC819_14900 [Cyclobacteriaceae bacterium]|nr:hypothetical protein [Cyclobacteriaceae bacterium]
MYSNAHKLRMIRKVCDIYRQHQGKGLTTRHIYRRYIYPVYPISMGTLYNYLNTPVGAKERELEESGRTTLT